LKIIVIAVGTLKEAYFQAACREYLKRLGPMIRVEIIEVKETSLETKSQEALIKRVLEREGEQILKRIPDNSRVVVLGLQGKQVDSVAFSAIMEPVNNPQIQQLVFIIGGSHGLADEVYQAADECLSFGPMTFPHQLARIMLLEQIYRGQMILAGRTYHK
jgi:23S rRNA (pseudouridine1915-N3)-methyltransferase